MSSKVRGSVLGHEVGPIDTGDIAWRATIPLEDIERSQNEELIRIVHEQRPHGWVGPSSHVAFYPLRGGSVYNLVLA